MKPSDSSQDLAAILARGKSRPLRKWTLIALGVAALAGGAYYYFTKNGNGEAGPE